MFITFTALNRKAKRVQSISIYYCRIPSGKKQEKVNQEEQKDGAFGGEGGRGSDGKQMGVEKLISTDLDQSGA